MQDLDRKFSDVPSSFDSALECAVVKKSRRSCELPGCGMEFSPRQSNARFCSRAHKDAGRNLERRRCKNCRSALDVSVRFQRFCSSKCRWSYLQTRRRAQSVTQHVSPRDPVEPVSVLLPLGCEPRRHEQEEDPERIPEIRSLDCSRYERCLTYAASKNWTGFTCRLCPMRSQNSTERP